MKRFLDSLCILLVMFLEHNETWCAIGTLTKLTKLDIDSRRGDDASPMSSYRCMLGPTWILISALQHKSKYKSKFNFELFWEKNQIFGFPCCSTRENLSIYAPITNVGLILTKPGVISFLGVQTLGVRTKFNFELFWKKKNQIFEFPCCSAREDFSIDVSIANVGLILTKIRWFSFLWVRTDIQTRS